VLAFFERPIAGTLGVMTLVLWAGMLWHGWKTRPAVAVEPASPPP